MNQSGDVCNEEEMAGESVIPSCYHTHKAYLLWPDVCDPLLDSTTRSNVMCPTF